MALTAEERINKILDNLEIREDDSGRGYNCYVDYKDKQYYCSIIFDIHTGADCMIFPAMDNDVMSWTPLYRNDDIDLSINDLKNCIFKFLLSLK